MLVNFHDKKLVIIITISKVNPHCQLPDPPGPPSRLFASALNSASQRTPEGSSDTGDEAEAHRVLPWTLPSVYNANINCPEFGGRQQGLGDVSPWEPSLIR